MEAQEPIVTVCQSATDGAWLVFIDTTFEPDASDNGPGLRVYINDHSTYEGKPYPMGGA